MLCVFLCICVCLCVRVCACVRCVYVWVGERLDRLAGACAYVSVCVR